MENFTIFRKRINLCLFLQGFESATMSVEEPSDDAGDTTLLIPIIRMGGATGVIAVKWTATLNGMAYKRTSVSLNYSLSLTI